MLVRSSLFSFPDVGFVCLHLHNFAHLPASMVSSALWLRGGSTGYGMAAGTSTASASDTKTGRTLNCPTTSIECGAICRPLTTCLGSASFLLPRPRLSDHPPHDPASFCGARSARTMLSANMPNFQGAWASARSGESLRSPQRRERNRRPRGQTTRQPARPRWRSRKASKSRARQPSRQIPRRRIARRILQPLTDPSR